MTETDPLQKVSDMNEMLVNNPNLTDKEREFFSYLIQFQPELEKFCKNYIKKLSKTGWYDKKNKRWRAECDEWESFNDMIDINFFTDGDVLTEARGDLSYSPSVMATAYLYDKEKGVTSTSCMIYATKERK